MRNIKMYLLPVLALVIIVSLGACASSSSSTPASSSEAAVRTDIVYGLGSDIGSLDHTTRTDQISNIVWRQMYDTLVEKDKDGNFVGKLAKSWKVSDDGRTYTFSLRNDVICHDGQPMTAKDVAWSINREIKSSADGPAMVNMVDATIVDDYTVNINLSGPYSPTLEVLLAWGRIACASTTDFETNPIGTGPYKFVSRNSGDNIILKAWDKYYLGEASIKDLTFKVITDTTTAVAALQKGEIDFLTHVSLSAKNTIEQDKNLVWLQKHFRGNIWVTMRNDKAPFDDILARKAVQYCIDKQAILAAGNEGQGQLLQTMWPNTVTASPEDLYTAPYTYDLAKAKDYLNQYKAKTGVDKVSVTILAPETAMYLNPATTLEGMMLAAGFDVTTSKIDRSTFWSSLVSGNYQIAVAGTSWPVADADANYIYFHSSAAGGQNYAPIINTEIDDLMVQARNSTDIALRKENYKKVQEITDENAYIVTLYAPDIAVAYSAKLKGVDTVNNLYQHYVYDWSW